MRLATWAVVLAGLCGLVAGCGGGSSGSSTSAASASNAAAKSGTTAPGSGLAVGQTATVPYTPLTSSGNGKARTLEITVASIHDGTAADLKGVDLSGAPKGAVPQYAAVTVTNSGPSSIDVDATSDAMQGIDHGGNQQDPVSFIGDFPPCPQNSSTTPVATGQSFHTCLTYLVSGGITKVAYTGTDSYTSSPVTWSAGG
ncbi:MAG: hypothetical protein ACRDPA_24190 [Solirubrobacteraceae bacterium]